MKAKIAWTEKRDIEVSECGAFCLCNCSQLQGDGMHDDYCDAQEDSEVLEAIQCRVNGTKWKRTDFCKRKEVKGATRLECGSRKCPTMSGEMFIRNTCDYCPKYNLRNAKDFGDD
jgi:hypothetical protein